MKFHLTELCSVCLTSNLSKAHETRDSSSYSQVVLI